MKLTVLTVAALAVAVSAKPEHYVYHGPPAPLDHEGKVVDTPEVAHAKHAHLAALEKAKSETHGYGGGDFGDNGIGRGDEGDDGKHYHGHSEPVHFGHEIYHHDYKYHGPPAPLDHHTGKVVETPEVAHLKAAHLEAYAKAAARAGYGGYGGGEEGGDDGHHPHVIYQSPGHYKGPPAPLGKDGRVVDTPEVAHAKLAFLAAHSKALHSAPSYYGGGFEGGSYY